MTDTHDKSNITQSGDKFKATVTRHFNSMEEASTWTDAQTYTDTPERAGSDITVEEAVAINSNVVAAPVAPGTEIIKSGAGQDDQQATQK